MNDPKAQALLNEIRYAERLCERTARLYRRLHACSVFFTVAGGSAALSALSARVPDWVSIAGAAAFTLFGAWSLAVRPQEKAVANEADARKYAQLRTRGHGMSATGLQAALNIARETDAPEVEPLRDVAWNDVVAEIGAPGAIPLRPHQRLLAALA